MIAPCTTVVGLEKKKWSDSGYILKVEQIGFPDRLSMGYGRQGIIETTLIFLLNNWKAEAAN